MAIYRCPRCGMVIRGRRFPGEQDDCTTAPGAGPASRQLFGCPEPEPRRRCLRFCCDRYGDHTYGPEYRRNNFWPWFSRPRWLRCDELYCRINNANGRL